MTRTETVAAQQDAAWEEFKTQRDTAWRAELQELLDWDQSIEDELGPVFIPRSAEDDETEDAVPVEYSVLDDFAA